MPHPMKKIRLASLEDQFERLRQSLARIFVYPLFFHTNSNHHVPKIQQT